MNSDRDMGAKGLPAAARLTESRASTLGTPERRKPVAPETARQMLHELRVHQLELETQNEELRRTQAELDAARERYFDLYDRAPVGYCSVSATEHILEANLTAAELLGLERSQLVGLPLQQFIAPMDQHIYFLHRKGLFEAGHPQSCELRMLRQDGSQFWAHLLATHADADTDHTSHRLVLTDIHAQKVAQNQIRISDLALKSISQGVLITTPDLYIVSANKAFSEMTGYTESELIGAACSIFYGPLTDTSAMNTLQNAIDTGSAFSAEVVNYRKDGSHFWNALSVTAVLDDLGQVTNFISINIDISERKRLDQILQDKNAELQRATTLADKANRAKSDFISSMSHELRSPLNAILGFTQLLEVGPPAPAPAQQDKIDKILRGGWYLVTLINEILDLALIESGKLALTLEPLPLAQVLQDCQSLIEPLAEQSGIHISFPSLAGPYIVIADAVRLQQVIINLLSNAIKYNRSSGSVTVTVDTPVAGTLRIAVHDTGSGMSAQQLAQLFQPFNRLGRESSSVEGTGIGLVVTRRLTELMGGKVGVQSTVGVGSIFWVELSVAQTLHHAAPCVTGSAGPHEPVDAPDRTPRTVLYVEDNQSNMELMEQILAARTNLRLLTAHEATQGIELARRHHPDVILMDINLPGISGVEALRLLRQIPATRHIPVLAISANAMPLDVVKGLSDGFFRYLTKPFRVDAFFDVLDEALAFVHNQTPVDQQ